jgi:glycosyltransferase involved in cell wall biosynthesis
MLLLKDVEPDIRVLREARSLTGAGYEVWVAHLGRKGRVDIAPNLRLVGIRLLTRGRGMPRGRVAQAFKALEFLLRTAALARRISPRVIHAHDLPCLILGVLLRAICSDCCLVYDAHELWPDMAGRRPTEARLGRFLERWAIRRAKVVITVNKLAAGTLETRYGTLRLVPIGNKTQPYEGRTDLHLRELSGASGEETLVLCLGTFSQGRGLRKLVEAIGLVRPPVRLVFLGDGPAAPELRRWVTAYGVEHRVSFLPAVSQRDLPGWIRGADIGVILYEDTCLNHRLAQPNKLFQFLEAGVPVVASNLPGIREIVETYGVGELVPPNNTPAIAAAIQRLSGLEYRGALTDLIGVNRRAFLWSADEPRLLEAYHELTSGEVPGCAHRLRNGSLPA